MSRLLVNALLLLQLGFVDAMAISTIRSTLAVHGGKVSVAIECRYHYDFTETSLTTGRRR